MTAPSCMEVRAPITIGPLSARMTAPGQTLAFRPEADLADQDRFWVDVGLRVDPRSFLAQRVESHGVIQTGWADVPDVPSENLRVAPAADLAHAVKGGGASGASLEVPEGPVRQDLMKSRRSASTVSAWVVGMPWGYPA